MRAGHLWATLLGGGATMMTLIHVLSNGLMLAGLVIMGAGWRQIHLARGGLVVDGLYRWLRHPQYSGLFLITVGLLIQWPTIVTLLTFPILIVMYVRLARREEREMEAIFGGKYLLYKAATPAFFPWPRPPLIIPSWPASHPPADNDKGLPQGVLPSLNGQPSMRPGIRTDPSDETEAGTREERCETSPRHP